MRLTVLLIHVFLGLCSADERSITEQGGQQSSNSLGRLMAQDLRGFGSRQVDAFGKAQRSDKKHWIQETRNRLVAASSAQQSSRLPQKESEAFNVGASLLQGSFHAREGVGDSGRREAKNRHLVERDEHQIMRDLASVANDFTDSESALVSGGVHKYSKQDIAGVLSVEDDNRKMLLDVAKETKDLMVLKENIEERANQEALQPVSLLVDGSSAPEEDKPDPDLEREQQEQINQRLEEFRNGKEDKPNAYELYLKERQKVSTTTKTPKVLVAALDAASRREKEKEKEKEEAAQALERAEIKVEADIRHTADAVNHTRQDMHRLEDGRESSNFTRMLNAVDTARLDNDRTMAGSMLIRENTQQEFTLIARAFRDNPSSLMEEEAAVADDGLSGTEKKMRRET